MVAPPIPESAALHRHPVGSQNMRTRTFNETFLYYSKEDKRYRQE